MKKFIFILLIILYLMKNFIFYKGNSYNFDSLTIKNNATAIINIGFFTNLRNENKLLNLEEINNLTYFNKTPYLSCFLVQDFLPYVQYNITRNLGKEIQYKNMDYIILRKDEQILGYYFIPSDLINGYVYQNNIFYEVKFTRPSKYILAIGEKCYEISK